MYPAPVREGVVRGARPQAARPAPGLRAWVDDHLAVPRHVCRHIPIARPPVVLPAPADVHQVELAPRPPSSLDV